MNGVNHMKFGLASSVGYGVITGHYGVSLCAAPIVVIASLLPDVDSPKSKANKYLKMLTPICLGVFAVMYLVDKAAFSQLSVLAKRNEMFVLGLAILGLAIFLGKTSKHRTFSHRIYGSAMFIIAAYLISPVIAPYFAIGYLSHIIGDSLTTNKVEFLAPLFPVPLGLGLFKSGGQTENAVVYSYIVIVGFMFIKVAGGL